MIENLNNLYDIIEHYAKKTPAQISHIYKDEFGREIRVSYRNFLQSINKITYGLISLGITKGTKVAQISHTCYEWTLMDFSLLSIGAVNVPRGVDTPMKELSNILDHAEPEYMIVETYRDLVKLVPQTSWKKYKKIIILRKGIPYPKQRLISLHDLYELGEIEAEKHRETVKELRSQVNRDTLATIIYTSGTTGVAKGVMLTHGNFISDIICMTPNLNSRPSDVWISILPVWHVFERTGEYMAYFAGSTIVFSNVQRVSSDIAEYRPTFMTAVPKLYITIKDKILMEFNKKPQPLKTVLFALLRARQGFLLRRNAFLNRRFIRTPEEMEMPFNKKAAALIWMMLYAVPAGLGYLLFGSIRKKMGGKVRAFISGGGSLPVDTDLFFHAVGIPLINAYGATETSPGVSGRRTDDFIPGTIGKPFPGTEITIRNEEGQLLPKGVQGEIWVRGPQVMQGYYKEPELTREVLTEDGWYRTGDLGVISYNNHIKITGRIKSMIVLLNGENIQPEPIEEAMQKSPFIQMSVVVGQDEKHLSALVVPFFENIQEHLAKQGKLAKEKMENWEELVDLPHIKQLITDEVTKLVNKNADFKPFEKIKSIKILPKEFKIGEELTQTLKVKRKVIHDKYKHIINELYGKKEDKED